MDNVDVAGQCAQTIFTGLKDGIEAINCITVTILNRASAKHDFHKKIQADVEKAKTFFEESDEAANQLLEMVDELYEGLVSDTQTFKEEAKHNEAALSQLREEKETNKHLLRRNREALESYQEQWESKAREEKQNNLEDEIVAEETRNVIPMIGALVGWIPGLLGWAAAGMVASRTLSREGMVASRTLSREASKTAAQIAKCEQKMGKYKRKISENKKDIKENRKSITDIKESLEDIQEQIRYLRKQRNTIAEFQRMLREAVNLLDRIAGRLTVMEFHTRRSAKMEAVVKLLGSVITLIEEIPGVEALHDKGMRRLIQRLRRNYTKIEVAEL